MLIGDGGNPIRPQPPRPATPPAQTKAPTSTTSTTAQRYASDGFDPAPAKPKVSLTTPGLPNGSSVTVESQSSIVPQAPAGTEGAEGTEGEGEGTEVGIDAGVYTKGTYTVGDVKTNPGLKPTQTLTVTGETGVYASGSVDAKAFEFEGKVYQGVRTSYSTTVTPDQATAIRNGQAPVPNPYDPSTIPVGGKVLITGDDVKGSEFEAAWHHLAIETGHEDFSGQALGVQKTDPTHVKITYGPEDGVTNDLFAGIEAGPVKVGVGNETTETDRSLKTVTIDLSNPKGQAAYQKFLLTGEIPKEDPSQGVDKAGTITQFSLESESSITAKLGPIGGSLSLGTSGADVTETKYEDGTMEREARFDYGDKSAVLTQSFDASGNEKTDEQKVALLMNNVDPTIASYLNTAFTGVQNKSFDGNQQVEIDFSPEQFSQLRDRAQQYCKQMYPGWQPTDNVYDSNVNGGPEQMFIDRIASAKTPADLQAAFIDNIGGTGSMGEALLTLAAGTRTGTDPSQIALPGSYADAQAA